jgi:hypothetical protein
VCGFSSLESEWSTWLLLVQLRLSESAPSSAAPTSEERYSSERIALRFAPAYARELRILNWLEELSVYTLSIEERGEVSFRKSLRKLQKHSDSRDSSAEFLDPDVEFRLRERGILSSEQNLLELQDIDEEHRLLQYVWQLLRCNRLNESIDLCRAYGQHWRAASLQGGERWHEEPNDAPAGGRAVISGWEPKSNDVEGSLQGTESSAWRQRSRE